MRFAVSLLTVLGIASIIGTVLKQNEPYANYVVEFGQFWFNFFEMLGLYDVYHSVWFLAILLFLVASTSLCIYRNSPLMLRELRAFREHATEHSLSSFSHQQEYQSVHSTEETKQRLTHFLGARGFRFKTVSHRDGSQLIAAKAGSYQRLGYIFTHLAIVVICIGGLIDGNVPFKVQELLGYKKVETLDIPASQVPAVSRMSVANLSFRANMTLPEGNSANVAFMRIRDGYLVQELPFSIALKDFRIEHYATGQPKSFESDIVINDPDLKQPLAHTISVNHPLIYKGIAIYQSSFEDGGSQMDFNVWGLLSNRRDPLNLHGTIFQKSQIGQGADALIIEFNDFRLFNILNLTPDGKGKPRNVGPSVTFKVRDAAGQAHEYINYMQPLLLSGHPYFVSGMRATQQEDFRYLRIPADEDFLTQGFMNFRAIMFDKTVYPEIAHRLSGKALAGRTPDAAMQQKFEDSVVKLLEGFSSGGYSKIAEMIEKSVPEADREKAAQTYIKIISNAALEAYNLSLERAGKKPTAVNETTQVFVQDSLNAISDLYFYGAPFYLEMTKYQQREASGLQLTRSPGKTLVYSGSILLVLGIFSMIYIRERRIWLLVKPNSVLFVMSANRKNRDLDIEFNRYREQLQNLLQT
ncbi:MAG TPA: cytochrome c biogenesis protein ResB [Methylophilaceae bacterium]|jgi:cytochrome c biogenesis protein